MHYSQVRNVASRTLFVMRYSDFDTLHNVSYRGRYGIFIWFSFSTFITDTMLQVSGMLDSAGSTRDQTRLIL